MYYTIPASETELLTEYAAVKCTNNIKIMLYFPS